MGRREQQQQTNKQATTTQQQSAPRNLTSATHPGTVNGRSPTSFRSRKTQFYGLRSDVVFR
eukprot:7547724-Pyramimonas_sp.AAC.1